MRVLINDKKYVCASCTQKNADNNNKYTFYTIRRAKNRVNLVELNSLKFLEIKDYLKLDNWASNGIRILI